MKLPCSKCGRVEPKRCGQQGCPYFGGSPRTFKQDFSGQAPSIFVGSWGYPHTRVGILASEHASKDTDNPIAWSTSETPIPKIVEQRGSLINSHFTTHVKSFSERLAEKAQLVAQAKKTPDADINLTKQPQYSISYPAGSRPHGPSVGLKQARLTENVKIARHVEKAVADTDLKASDAITQLYRKSDVYQLPKLLSAGVLGQGSNRKIVPTKWSITAVDDTLGKELLKKVRDQPVINEHTAYFGGHYGNYYCILLYPKPFFYELFELYTGKRKMETRSWTDHEEFSGRTSYAKDTAGGYYAARLVLLEKLKALGRQASCLVIRFTTDEYTNPLGVWVVREAVRKAMDAQPVRFGSRELLEAYAAARCRQYGVDWESLVKKSKLHASLKQKSLWDY